jgi:hypothetical protein
LTSEFRFNADLFPFTTSPILNVSLAASIEVSLIKVSLAKASFEAEKFKLAFSKAVLLITVSFQVELSLSSAAAISKDAATTMVRKPNEYIEEYFM